MFSIRPSRILDPYGDLSPIEAFMIDVEAAIQLGKDERSLADEVEEKWRRLGVYR